MNALLGVAKTAWNLEQYFLGRHQMPHVPWLVGKGSNL